MGAVQITGTRRLGASNPAAVLSTTVRDIWAPARQRVPAVLSKSQKWLGERTTLCLGCAAKDNLPGSRFYQWENSAAELAATGRHLSSSGIPAPQNQPPR
jgi:hypothetical protein